MCLSQRGGRKGRRRPGEAASCETQLWRLNPPHPPGSFSTWSLCSWLFFSCMGSVCWTGQGRPGKKKAWNPPRGTQADCSCCGHGMCPLDLPGLDQKANQALFFILLCASSRPVFPPTPHPENTPKLTPIPMACLGGQRGMNCPELEGLLLEERTVRCRVCGELGLQSATLMTQKLNIASDINRASHRANTGPPSPSTGSHEH